MLTVRPLPFGDAPVAVLFFRLIFSLLPAQLGIFQTQVRALRAHLLRERGGGGGTSLPFAGGAFRAPTWQR